MEMQGKLAPSKPYRQYGYSKAYLFLTLWPISVFLRYWEEGGQVTGEPVEGVSDLIMHPLWFSVTTGG